MCLGALASQTGGSITRPASYCGVYSIKPTYGRVSVDGVMPLAPSMDHVGAMANCVRDLAILFQTIAGPHRDPDYWLRNSYEPIPDCVSVTSRGYGAPGLPIIRLGGLFSEAAKPDLLNAFNESIGKLEAEWAPLENVVLPASFVDQPAAHRLVMAVEAATYHEERFLRHPDDYPPRIRELIEEGIACRGVGYSKAFWFMDELRRIASAMLGRGNRSVVAVTAATSDFAPTADTTGDPKFNSPWSFTGLPTISLPSGWSADGLPCAIQLIGDHGKEADLFGVATWCQEALGFERRPIPL
jgi:aspartyl-tRNA(Asn)/glutamyl-tRNA(Gln) amidotransferase subunit A